MKLETLLIHPAAQALGWALLHFIWQGAALAALFFITVRLTGRSQAKLRYATGCIAMLLMLSVFVATVLRSHPSAAPAPQFGGLEAAPGAGGTQFGISPGSPILPGPRSLFPERIAALPGLAVCLWLAGIVVLSIFTAGGWIRVQRLRGRGAEPVSTAWSETLDGLMRRLQVSRPVRLYTSTVAEVPMLIGWVRPYILLPVSAITGLSEAQLRAILAHELAHVRRHDYLMNLLQTAVETLFFYHPAVWWVSRRVREEREYCCDDLAVAVCADVMVYADALAQLEELRGCYSEPALAATGGDLLTRIRRLVGQGNEKGRDRIPGPVGVSMAVALVFCAVIAAGNVPAIRAQSKLLEFEVASIKPTDPNIPHMVGVKIHPGGRVAITAVPLKTLVGAAFQLSYWQISGGPQWVEKDNYDIEAQPPENLRSSIKDRRYTWHGIEDARLREMLQALLIDRFQLKFHRETKTGDVYRLERNGKTLRLRPAETPSSEVEPTLDRFASIGYVEGRWSLFAYSMPQLAKFASDYVLRVPVLDRTELSGLFDYKQTQSDPEPNYTDNSASFLRLIQEVGLKLERARGPVETFVIDQAAKPSPN